MRAKVLFLAVSTMLIGAAALAQPAPTEQAPATRLQPARIDKDGDGTISRAEAGAKPRLAARFDSLDRDKDGKLSKQEMQVSRAAGHARHKAALQQRFKDADKDGDGMLSKAEAESAKMPGITAQFNKADANHDGKLSQEEMRTGRKRLHDEQAARFKAADKDGDGTVSKAEAQAGELPGLLKHFDRLDANHDGKIGPEEMHARKGRPRAKTM